MRRALWLCAVAVGMCVATTPAGAEETPKYGGTLTYMIPADAPPTFDGHRETTYATVHTAAPFYSVLIRLNPDDPASTTVFSGMSVPAAMMEPAPIQAPFKITDPIPIRQRSAIAQPWSVTECPTVTREPTWVAY